RVLETRLLEHAHERLAVPHGAVAVRESDLRDGQQRRRATGPILLDELPVARIAPQVVAEVGYADPYPPPGREQTRTLLDDVEGSGEREVLEHVLQDHGFGRAVGERQAPAEIPVQVGVHPHDVDVDPAGKLVHAAAEMKPE